MTRQKIMSYLPTLIDIEEVLQGDIWKAGTEVCDAIRDWYLKGWIQEQE